MNVSIFLFDLIKQGHFWQYMDINGNGKKPKLFFIPAQIFAILIAILIPLFLLPKGFKMEFVGYIIASLSIFAGLFLSLIITVYDKFRNLDFSLAKDSEKEKVLLIKTKNFFKQFTSLTSYSILILLICIILLCLSLLFDFSNKYVDYKLLLDSSFNIILLKRLALLIHRVLILYLLFNFVIISIFAISSIHNFIISEYDKINIKENKF